MINDLNDLENNYQINKAVLNKIRQKHIRQGMDDENYLTDLQKSAFSDPCFWEESKHIIIQGRTSSGKTLVAQIAAAYYGAKELSSATGGRKRIIYLVPLRAMVSEKRAEFMTLFEETLGWRVYASSSDYQDHDEDILNANFDIAVIVYEKFFALLAQDTQSSFIVNCGLVIVDELQMMNDEGRGPKLEIALTKIMTTQSNCKIIGLTTTQCDIKEISKWLKAKAIINNNRPKALEEYVIWPGEAGDAFYCYELEEPEDGTIIPEKHEKHPDGGIKISLENQNFDIFENDLYAEQKMIPAMISHILKENKNAKILVFINNRRDTKKIARDICDFLSDFSSIYEDKIEDENIEILLSGGDEDAADMISDTLPYGVAYHHGGFSRGLRDYVEEEFRRDSGKIHIVVATETLAIGVNMPADVVILAGVVKPSGKNVKNQIRSHEYKNYVGRAGRLGKGSAQKGKSYLLASTQATANDYWSRYVKSKQVPISSALRKLPPKEQVPFFFNLIDTDDFDAEKFNEKIQETFAFYGQRDMSVDKKELPGKEFIDYLSQYNLIEASNVMGNKYSRSRIGDELVSYALDLDTVDIIFAIWKQIEDFKKKEKDDREIAQPQFFKEHCLDFLYCLSGASELRSVFVQNRDEVTYTQNALKYVRQMQNELIEGWPLRNMIEEVFVQGKQLPNLNRSFAVKRAISMFGWIKGKKIEEIKKETGLDYIAFGDLDRLGDVFAYLWEAMVRVCSIQMDEDEHGKFRGSLLHFSGCLKYGVEEELVVLASRHITYVTRGQLMSLKEEAKKKHLDTVQYIRNPFISMAPKTLSPLQYRQLVEELNKYYYASATIGNMSNTTFKMVRQRLLDREERALIEKIKNWENTPFKEMGELFSNNKHGISSLVYGNFIELTHKERKLYIYMVEGSHPITGVDFLEAMKNLGIQERANGEKDVRIYVSSKGFDQKEIVNLGVAKGVFLSVTAFLKLYLLSLKKTSTLSLFCMSLYSGYDFIPDDDKTLNVYIMNFMPQEPLYLTERNRAGNGDNKKVKMYIVHDKVKRTVIYDDFWEELTKELAQDGLELEVRTMIWGDSVCNFAYEILDSDEYVMVFVNDSYLNQRGLPILMDMLKEKLDAKRFLLAYYDEKVKESFLEKYPTLKNCEKMEVSSRGYENSARKVYQLLKQKQEENEMFDVFISYAHGQEIAGQMKDVLEAKGCKVFIDKNLHIGDSLVNSINEALRKSKSYLLVIDKNFVNNAWTNEEAKATFLMKLQDKRILPLMVDDEAKKYWIESNPLYADCLTKNWDDTNADDLADEIMRLL